MSAPALLVGWQKIENHRGKHAFRLSKKHVLFLAAHFGLSLGRDDRGRVTADPKALEGAQRVWRIGDDEAKKQRLNGGKRGRRSDALALAGLCSLRIQSRRVKQIVDKIGEDRQMALVLVMPADFWLGAGK